MNIELLNIANNTTIMAEAVIVVVLITVGAYMIGKYSEFLSKL